MLSELLGESSNISLHHFCHVRIKDGWESMTTDEKLTALFKTPEEKLWEFARVISKYVQTLQPLEPTRDILWRVKSDEAFQDQSGLPEPLITLKAFDEHLSVQHVKTPFNSFFSSWGRVLKRRKRCPHRGATNIRVIALWTEGLPVYDAYAIAEALRYSNDEQEPRRQLSYISDEWLMANADCDYTESGRVTAVFDRCGENRTMELWGPGKHPKPVNVAAGMLGMPGEMLRGNLKNIVHMRTGLTEDSAQFICLESSSLEV
ncbi:hypothetical protein P152DRAFT_196173 [Eremomyces bilateralis CBS 781.70]|uniref:Uncharacterized protein n=1 Tax=Eremomyces bilateralis CBS 781.70 TaxID=1392243 RepID=A0A6G1GCP5_9PEZI|nr:uncharacterized protein P152DRAFT_196173 [Eremomyces bilateralis CBS 781.70]KAF1815772.1 hypothetical protein P152DRAFT_196173 [Eremomyces bilateralis CBS 781.70]